MNTESPEAVLAALKEECSSQRAHRNLDNVHKTCAQIVRDKLPLTPARLGRKTAALGGPSLNTLYAPGGARFRRLMNAWQATRGETGAPRKKTAPDDTAILKTQEATDDPVIRSLLGMQQAEIRRLKRENTDLRSSVNLSIDLRSTEKPTYAASDPSKTELLPTEWDALKYLVEGKWLQRVGWTEGARGEVFCAAKSILPVGTLTALRKLANLRPASE